MRLLRATWALSVPALVLAALWFVRQVTSQPTVALDDGVGTGLALAVVAPPVAASLWAGLHGRCTLTYAVTLVFVLGGATWDGGGRSSLWLTAIVAHLVVLGSVAGRARRSGPRGRRGRLQVGPDAT